MWVFSVLFLLSGLITIVGLFLLIPKKTRTKGKQISSIFLIICMISYLITPKENNEQASSESYEADKNHESEDETIPDTPITKKQYQQIEIGMTNKEVEKQLKKPSEGNISDLGDRYQWTYSDDNLGLAYIEFSNKTNKVVEKSEIGLLSDDSATVTDKNGTRDDDSLEPTNEDYTYDVEFAIEDAIGETVNWDEESKDVVKKIEVNDNIGKNDGSKLILVHLNGPIALTGSGVRKKVNEQTLEIAKALTQDDSLDFEIDSITYWWYLPLTDSYGKTKEKTAYKISLERDTLENINYEDLAYVDLPTIADQYNVLFNDQE